MHFIRKKTYRKEYLDAYATMLEMLKDNLPSDESKQRIDACLATIHQGKLRPIRLKGAYRLSKKLRRVFDAIAKKATAENLVLVYQPSENQYEIRLFSPLQAGREKVRHSLRVADLLYRD